jgi:nucleoredoxin
VLSDKYTKLKEAGKEFELIFVSSDQYEKTFKEYHAEMSFHALPFSKRSEKEKLSKMFKVSGIPSLVFLDKDGLITDSGRAGIQGENFIENFPYRPRGLFELLGDKLLGKEGEVTTKAALEGKSVLALYFSAHWCGPCRSFTPTLGQRYTALKAAGKDIEMVFVSSDRDEEAFKEYFAEMPFLALPFSKRSEKAELSSNFKVNGIPTLILLDAKTGKIINEEGRGAISAETYIEDYPFLPKPVNDIAASMSGINDEKCFLYLMDSAPKEEQTLLTEELMTVAETELKKPDDQQIVTRFFTAKGGGPISQIRTGCGLDSKTQMVILNFDDNGAFYVPADGSDIVGFLNAFKDGTLERKQFAR